MSETPTPTPTETEQGALSVGVPLLKKLVKYPLLFLLDLVRSKVASWRKGQGIDLGGPSDTFRR